MADIHAGTVILNAPTPTEEDVAYLGPALFSNRFSISIASVVRIAFSEQEFGTTKTPHFRTAVTLSHQDAIQLYQLLERMLKPYKEQLDALSKETKDGVDA